MIAADAAQARTGHVRLQTNIELRFVDQGQATLLAIYSCAESPPVNDLLTIAA